jgi:hypothetical protein
MEESSTVTTRENVGSVHEELSEVGGSVVQEVVGNGLGICSGARRWRGRERGVEVCAGGDKGAEDG